MKKKLLIVLLIAILISFIFWGCRSGSHQPYMANVNSVEITPKEATVNSKGKFPKITFPSSGVTFELKEENSVQPGVIVTVIEEKTYESSYRLFDSPSDSYIYSIKAHLNVEDPVTHLISEIPVCSLEKPFTVIIPNKFKEKGTCYIGIRENENDIWRFSRVIDTAQTIANFVSIRANDDTTPKSVTFELYRAGIQLGLFIIDREDKDNVDKSFIDYALATPTATIITKTNIYDEDLKLELTFKGINLDRLKNTDLTARITYRTESEIPVTIKANNKTYKASNQKTTDDKAVTGNKYAHSFDVDITDFDSLMSSQSDANMILNIKGLNANDFPSNILIEFFSKDKYESLPFIFYQYLVFDTFENPLDQIVMRLATATNNVFDSEKDLYQLKPSFVLTPEGAFKEEYKTRFEEALNVTNIASDDLLMAWNDEENSLSLAFKNKLVASKSYTIAMDDIEDIASTVVTPFSPFTFNTIGTVTFALVASTTNIYEDKLYHLKPSFKITPSYKKFDTEYKDAIASSVKLLLTMNNKEVGSNILSKNWDASGSLNLKPIKNLNANATYTLLMQDPNFTEILIATFSALQFKTIEQFVIALSEKEGNVFDTDNSLYKLKPTFYISPGFKTGNIEKAIIASAVTVLNVASSTVNKVWENNKLVLSFNKALTASQSYTLSVSDVNSFEGLSIAGFEPLAFKTIGTITFNLTNPNTNIFADNRYQLKPIFTITPTFTNLSDETKAAIASSVRVLKGNTELSSNIFSKAWFDNNLVCSFTQNLDSNASYKLTMASFNIENVPLNKFADLNFTTVGKYNIALSEPSPNTNVFDTTNNLYQLKPTFTVTPSYKNFSNSEKTAIANAIRVLKGNTELDSDLFKKNWVGDDLLCSFNQNLEENKNYTISMKDVTLDGVAVTKFNNLAFKTMPVVTFAVTDSTDSIYDTVNSLYQLKPVFSITPSYSNFTNTHKKSIKDSVKITYKATGEAIDSNLYVMDWSGNSLVCTFTQNLNTNTEYLISMENLNIPEITITSMANTEFKTIEPMVISLNNPDSNKNNTSRYCLQPTFDISVAPVYTGFGINEKNIASNAVKIKLKDTGAELGEDIVSKVWNNNVMTISFLNNLDANATYTFSLDLDYINNNNNGLVFNKNFNNFDFTTIESYQITCPLIADNKYYNDLYHLEPSFTVRKAFDATIEEKDLLIANVHIEDSEHNIISDGTKFTKAWVDDHNIRFTSTSPLDSNKTYKIYMNDIDIPGKAIVPFVAQTFTTLSPITFTIDSPTTNLYNSTQYTRLVATFTITPSIVLKDSERTAILPTIALSGGSTTGFSPSRDDANNKFNVSCAENLNTDTNYQEYSFF